jgi:hypothetical protein
MLQNEQEDQARQEAWCRVTKFLGHMELDKAVLSPLVNFLYANAGA